MRVQTKLSLSLTILGTLVVSGCVKSADPVMTSFFRESGAVLDTEGHFGAATANNAAIMSGEKQYTVALARRFAEEVPSKITFAFDSAVLDQNARAILRQQADWIRQFPEARFRVYGHTDLVGSEAYNKRLGLRRANAVVSYLGTQGISRSRLEAVASFGETKPLIVTEGRERRNRRTVTEVSGFVERHPTIMDGKYAQVIYREYVQSAQPASTLSQISIASSTDGGGP
ncbi:Outer membrane protein OmpA [Salinihabitans flavidus]|uniref:Outer membrane protein OmpA n=1 Tax=Salinihabitans flavidus TaxID=569882 RepID=A0A1H8UVE1_9RHOB|nr:OmpA family protein [Salinihabitans flavidus]SEP06963.1 Outer membrane protein OmpA [Salinihabitans flavidus]